MGESKQDKKVLTLAQRLLNARKNMKNIKKDAHNNHQNYDYASAENVLSQIRKQLDKEGVTFKASSKLREIIEPARMGGGKQHMVILDSVYTLINADNSEDREESSWSSTGMDFSDKAIYKAYTGGIKYFLLQTFLIGTGDDPENDDENNSCDTATQSKTPKTFTKEQENQAKDKISQYAVAVDMYLRDVKKWITSPQTWAVAFDDPEKKNQMIEHADKLVKASVEHFENNNKM